MGVVSVRTAPPIVVMAHGFGGDYPRTRNVAVIGHEGSTVLVSLIGLRLLGFSE